MKHCILIAVIAMAILAVPSQSMAQEAKKEEKKWFDNVTLKGDVRLRYERIDEEGKVVRNRARIRARLGAVAAPNEELNVAIGIATGKKDDPVSRNETLTGGFSPHDFLLDYAYFDWHPSDLKGLSLLGGKLVNPFTAVSDIIWDGDVTPEGAAAKYEIGKTWKATLVGGAFSIEERAADDDTWLYGGQIKVCGSLAQMLEAEAGVSYYQFSNVDGFRVLDPTGSQKAYGNSYISAVENGATNNYYAYGYELVEPFVSLGITSPIPVTVFANYVNNLDADAHDTGYAAGIKLGKAKLPKSFEVGYTYKKVGKDATLGLLTDSDAWGGGTDGKAHKISAAYQINKYLQAGVTYFHSVKGLSKDTDYGRLQVDITAKF